MKGSMKDSYKKNKCAIKCSIKQYYECNKEAKKMKRKLRYDRNKNCAKAYRKKYYRNHKHSEISRVNFYNKIFLCVSNRHRYNLSEPKPYTKHQYVLTSKEALLGDTKLMKEVVQCFKSQQESAYEKRLKKTKCSRRRAIAQIATHRLIAKAMQMRKQYVGVLLKTVKRVYALVIKERNDFGMGLHSASITPYY